MWVTFVPFPPCAKNGNGIDSLPTRENPSEIKRKRNYCEEVPRHLRSRKSFSSVGWTSISLNFWSLSLSFSTVVFFTSTAILSFYSCLFYQHCDSFFLQLPFFTSITIFFNVFHLFFLYPHRTLVFKLKLSLFQPQARRVLFPGFLGLGLVGNERLRDILVGLFSPFVLMDEPFPIWTCSCWASKAFNPGIPCRRYLRVFVLGESVCVRVFQCVREKENTQGGSSNFVNVKFCHILENVSEENRIWKYLHILCSASAKYQNKMNKCWYNTDTLFWRI